MLPTADQIEVAAYHRWMNRGGHHGHHDADWAAAEQELLFALNYRVIARYRLDGIAPQYLGDEDEPRCRFCERTSPRATFAGPRLALPNFLGNESLFTSEVCDDCHAQFHAGLEGDLERFTRPARLGLGANGPTQAYVPVAAFKGLALAALAVLPEDEMGPFEDAIEWVSNPDHGLDSRSIRGIACTVHALHAAMPFSWIALARRVGDDDPLPYLIAFVGTGRAVFQVALPLCTRDEDIEGEWIVPRLASPFGPGRGPFGVESTVVPLSSPEPRREAIAPAPAIDMNPFGDAPRMPEPWRVLESRATFRDRWLSVRTDRCVDRRGREVEAYHVLEFPGWVNVVALTEDRRIVLAREYRHGLGAVVTGLPCGSMEPGDPGPEVAARRELEEETGYHGGRFHALSGLPANPANQTNLAWSFLALDVRPDGLRRPDPTEEIEVVLADFAPFLGRVWRGEQMVQVSHALALHQAGLYLMGPAGEDGSLRSALRAEFARTIGPG